MNREYFISREELASVFSPRAARQFEELQEAVASSDESATAAVDATGKLTDATYVTLSPNAELPNERVLALGEGLGFELTETQVILRLDGAALTEGGFSVRFVASGDSMVAVPLTGILATRENIETLKNKTIDAPKLSGLVDAADDAAAATASVPVGGIYRTGSALKVRVA